MAKGASRSGARRSRAADEALLFGSGAARRPLRPTTTSCLLSHAVYFRTWVRPRPTKITQRLGTRLGGRRLGRQRWPTGRGARLVGSSLIRSACAHRPSPAATDLARSSPRRLSDAIRLPLWLGKPSLRRSERRINQRLPEPGQPRPLSKAPGEACNPAALSAGLLVPTRPRLTGVPHYLPRKVADCQTPHLQVPLGGSTLERHKQMSKETPRRPAERNGGGGGVDGRADCTADPERLTCPASTLALDRQTRPWPCSSSPRDFPSVLSSLLTESEASLRALTFLVGTAGGGVGNASSSPGRPVERLVRAGRSLAARWLTRANKEDVLPVLTWPPDPHSCRLPGSWPSPPCQMAAGIPRLGLMSPLWSRDLVRRPWCRWAEPLTSRPETAALERYKNEGRTACSERSLSHPILPSQPNHPRPPHQTPNQPRLPVCWSPSFSLASPSSRRRSPCRPLRPRLARSSTTSPAASRTRTSASVTRPSSTTTTGSSRARTSSAMAL